MPSLPHPLPTVTTTGTTHEAPRNAEHAAAGEGACEGAAAVRALCPEEGGCGGVAFDGWDDGVADVTACHDCGVEGRIKNGAFVLDDPPRPSRAWERFEARWAEAHGK